MGHPTPRQTTSFLSAQPAARPPAYAPACSLGVLHWSPSVPVLEALMDGALEQSAALTPWMICNIMWGCARIT
jgi:hypothetical protein